MTPQLPPALVNHLWQSTLFVLLVWLATLALRNNRARVRCWLWTAASVKFLLPLSVLVRIGEAFEWRDAPPAVLPMVSFVIGDVLAPATITMGPASVAVPDPVPVLPWLLAIWVAGTAVVLISWLRQWIPIRSALRRATTVPLDAVYEADDLTVMSSPSMPEPGVVGIRHPRLLLPEGLFDRLTPEQLRALIAHERCHIRCHDNLAAAIHMSAEAIFWFHPAVWWIETRLIDERERACDEAVLRAGCRPLDYAEGILEVCRQLVGVRLACVAGVSGSNLRARVEAIMRNEAGQPMTRGRRWALAAAVVAAVGGPVAGGAMTAQSQVVVPPAGLAFETVSVKASKTYPGASPQTLAMEAGRLKRRLSAAQDGRFRTASLLHSVIQTAHNVTELQVEGGPPWVRSDRFAIEATAAADATPEQIRRMLQSLLADRFKLALRRETRTVPVYELVVADGGLKIAAMKEGDCVLATEIRWDLIDLEAPLFACDGGRRRTLSQSPETRPRPRWPRVDRLEFGGISISTLIDYVSADVDRVIIDKTGFAARFNLLLDFARAGDPLASGPTIFAAMQEQLGLLLRPTSGPIDVLVIDRVERPTEN